MILDHVLTGLEYHVVCCVGCDLGHLHLCLCLVRQVLCFVVVLLVASLVWGVVGLVVELVAIMVV